MTQALLFDCFGVIYAGTRRYVTEQCDASRREQLDDLFNQADYGYVSAQEFAQQAAELLDIDQQRFVEMTSRQYHRDEAVVGLIRRLRATYRVGLLTNANDAIIRQLFTKHELEELFDDVLVSSEVGMIKPSARFFELAATRLDTQPEECVLIDDMASNVAGAQAVGMQGIVFSNVDQCQRALEEYGIYA